MGVHTVDLSGILAYHAKIQPRRQAFVDANGGFDFEALQRRVNRLSGALLATGIRKGDRLALRLRNSRRHFEALFACARLGAVLVPLPTEAPSDDIDAIRRDCAPALVIESEEAYEAHLASASETELAPLAHSDDALLIMHTSGTTGRPKGAVLTHGNIIYTSFNQITGWRLTASDRALVVAPFHHAGGLLALGLPCLCSGGSVYVTAATPRCVLETIERECITAVFLPPRLWSRVADDAALSTARVQSVRLGASGGDPLPRYILERLTISFAAEFTDAYGMTETSSCLTLQRGDKLFRRHGYAGMALPYVRLKIINTDGGEAKPNETGEIAVAGPTVMRGYWQRPEETKAAFRGGWFRTGDLGRLDDEGYLQILGRATDVIVSAGGGSIFPSEIELVLREHPAVEEAVVIAIQRSVVANTIGAWVVLRERVDSTASELTAYCAKVLAKEKRPREIFICKTLPRNPNGKVDKAKLKEALVAGQSR
jgi:fatty-acyl-CoA synthase